MLKNERLLKLLTYFNVQLTMNIIIGIVYLFSKNSLREDFVIGVCTTLLFIFIFFFIKEYKAETLRQIRLQTKVVFRRQKLMLKFYSFFYTKTVVILLDFCRMLLLKYIYFILLSRMIKMGAWKKFFLSKLLFIKIYFVNLLQLYFNKIIIEVIKIKKK